MGIESLWVRSYHGNQLEQLNRKVKLMLIKLPGQFAKARHVKAAELQKVLETRPEKTMRTQTVLLRENHGNSGSAP